LNITFLSMNRTLPFFVICTILVSAIATSLQAQSDSSQIPSRIIIKSQVQIGNNKKEKIIEREVTADEDISELLDSIFNSEQFKSIEILREQLNNFPAMLDSVMQGLSELDNLDMDFFFRQPSVPSNKPFLGIVFEDIVHEQDDTLVKKGVTITRIVKGSSAEAAGLMEHDIIITLDDQPVNDIFSIQNVLQQKAIGDKITVVYERQGQLGSTVATLKPKPIDSDHWNPSMMFDKEMAIPSMPCIPKCDKIIVQKSGPRLGISITELNDEAREDLKVKRGGALITKVEQNSCASQMGLSINDVITGINHQKVQSPEQLKQLVNAIPLGSEVEIEYIRYGKKKKTKGVITEYKRAWD
jgi:membrane-associated protease RseP (regulator of RpoE activity)